MLEPRRCAAIVVGVDDYAFSPLTSCVNDAIAVRKALVQYRLVAPENVKLFAAPARGGAGMADRDTLGKALFEVYDKGDAFQRFFLYFAGHGVLRHVDSAHSRTSSVILPVDVEDLDRDGAKLIDLADLESKLSRRGPQEQVFIIDACRDMPYDREPDVSSMGWRAGDEGQQRKQALIQSVPPLGKASASKGGNGVFTAHFLEAVKGAGTAKEYDGDLERYVVSVKSSLEYVREQVRRSLEKVPRWQLYFSLPVVSGAAYDEMEPLRVLEPDEVKPVPFCIHIEPDAAAAATHVEVRHRGFPILEQSMPPRPNHRPVDLRPDRYKVEARSSAGGVVPPQALVDTREVDSITVSVLMTGGPAGVPAGTSPTDARVTSTKAPMAGPKTRPGRRKLRGSDEAAAPLSKAATGTLQVSAFEPQTRIEIQSLDRTDRREASGSFHEDLPAGAYEVRFRLGTDVFSSTQVYLDPGEVLTVSPQADQSPLVAEVTNSRGAQTVVFSETIGPTQGALLPTLLTLVGLKTFDTRGDILHQFTGVVPQRDPAGFGERPIVVVVAYDGDGWELNPRELVGGVRARVAPHIGRERPAPIALEQLMAGALGAQPVLQPGGLGFQRVTMGVVAAPSDSFRIDIDAPDFGLVSLSSASISRRVTVAAFSLRPDGRLEATQSLLRLPGLRYPGESGSDDPPARIVRALMVGQRLYSSRELLREAARADASILQMLLYAKRMDPIVSTMALLAQHREIVGRELFDVQARAKAGLLSDSVVDEALINLRRYFGELPDVHVVEALFRDRRLGMLSPQSAGPARPVADEIGRLVTEQQVPVLQEAARAMLAIVKARGFEHLLLEETVRRARPGEVWTVAVTPQGSETPTAVRAG